MTVTRRSPGGLIVLAMLLGIACAVAAAIWLGGAATEPAPGASGTIAASESGVAMPLASPPQSAAADYSPAATRAGVSSPDMPVAAFDLALPDAPGATLAVHFRAGDAAPPEIVLSRFSAADTLRLLAQDDDELRRLLAAIGGSADERIASSALAIGRGIVLWNEKRPMPAGGVTVHADGPAEAAPKRNVQRLTFSGLEPGFYVVTTVDPAFGVAGGTHVFAGPPPNDNGSVHVGWFRTGMARLLVRDPDGNPITGAHIVSADGGAALTGDGAGGYSGPARIGALANLVVSAPGYATQVVRLLVMGEGDPPAVVVLARLATLRVRFVFPGGKGDDAWLALCTERLEIWSASGGQWERTYPELDSDGTDSVTAIGLEAGPVRIGYSHQFDDGGAGIVPVALPPGVTSEVTLAALELAAIQVAVTDGRGLPIPNARIEAVPEDWNTGALGASGRTDERGAATVRGLTGGTPYTVTATMETAGEPRVRSGHALPGATLKLVFDDDATLTLRLHDADTAEPVPADEVAFLLSTDPADIAACLLLRADIDAAISSSEDGWQPPGWMFAPAVRASRNGGEPSPVPPPELERPGESWQVPPGSMTLIVRCGEHVPLAHPIRLDPGGSVSLDLAVSRGPRVRVRIETASGEPVDSFAHVRLTSAEEIRPPPPGESPWHLLVSLTSDSPEISGLPPLRYRVGLPGLDPVLADLRTQESVEVVLRWPGGASLSGTVTNADGTPAAGALVSAVAHGPGSDWTLREFETYADERGAYAIADLMPGYVQIHAQPAVAGASDPMPTFDDMELLRAGDNRIDLRLDVAMDQDPPPAASPQTVVVTVTHNGKPLPGALVWLGSGLEGESKNADAAGRALFTGKAAGEKEIRVSERGRVLTEPLASVVVRETGEPQAFAVEVPRVTYAFACDGATDGTIYVVSRLNSDEPLSPWWYDNYCSGLSGTLTLPPGRYWITVSAAGRSPLTLAVTLPIPLESPVRVDLTAEASIEVHLAVPAGIEPVWLWAVLLPRAHGLGERYIELDEPARQRYAKRGLAAGDYDLVVIGSARGADEDIGLRVRALRLNPGEPLTIEVQLGWLPAADVTVRRANGDPEPYALLRACPTADAGTAVETGIPWPDKVVNGRGFGRLFLLGDGPFTITVFAAGDDEFKTPLARREIPSPDPGSAPPAVEITLP